MSGVSRTLTVALVALVLCVALLSTVPLTPLDGNALGYDPSVAHLILLLLSVACVATAMVWVRSGPATTEDGPPDGPPDGASPDFLFRPDRSRWFPVAIAAAAAVLVYFPPFLSQVGPYLEDSYFLTVLHRMTAGQTPYADFEFQYGPLMLFPLWGWIRVFGYSFVSYYAYLALLEALQWGFLAWLVGRLTPATRTRATAFFALAILLVNDNLGVSWNGWRRLLPVFALALLVSRHRSRAALAAVSALLGAAVAYSPEYGAAAALATVAVFGLLFLRRPALATVFELAAVSAGALVTWAAICVVLMGPAFPDYIAATLSVITSRAAGEAGFRFYWSLNSIATVGLLFLTCAVLGRGLRNARECDWSAGDLFIVASVAYALIALKSGMARADMYHLAGAVLPLAGVYLFRFPVRVVPLESFRRLGLVLVAIMSVTYLIGLAGAGRILATRWVSGAVAVVADGRSGPAAESRPDPTRAPSLEFERASPNPEHLAAGAWLAAPDRVDRPVLFYAETWGLDKFVGVTRTVYPTDDYLMSDDVGREMAAFLERRPDALVFMSRTAYASVFDGEDPTPDSNFYWPFRSPLLGVVLARVASTHYGPSVLEEIGRKQDRWNRTVGAYLRDRYTVTETFEDYVILERSGALAPDVPVPVG